MSAAAAALALPATSTAHGGISVAQGGGKGVQIAVQGSEAEANQVDLATTLAGPGTGDGSKVVYWIRPAGRERAVRVATDRDESGIHHAEIPTTGRGSWQDWDVSAYVTLSTGRRLRVTSDKSDPPGPAKTPAKKPATGSRPATTATSPPDDPTAADTTAAPVEDVSGEDAGAPGWVLPSLVVLVGLAIGAVAVGRRRKRSDEID